MNKNDCIIRLETDNDHRETEHLVREAFWNVYHPGCTEHYVLQHLRNVPEFVHELDLVMEKEGRIVGQIVFVRSHIQLDNGISLPSLTMGPICIAPWLHRQGFGRRLLDHSLELATALGYGCVCIEGNEAFYGGSGFRQGKCYGLRYRDIPEGMDAPFFLRRELIPGYLAGVTGVYGPPECYFIAEREQDAFEEYDRTFPSREKLVLPGQLN